MKCPHCLVDFHDEEQSQHVENDSDGVWYIGYCRCAACRKIGIRLYSANNHGMQKTSQLVRPKTAGRAPVPHVVSKKYANDYTEACLVLADSAKASAALSRRCLQALLRDEAKFKHQDLFKEIQELLDRNTLPSHIADSLDAVRNIGNFAAHPIKSQSTGEIVPVEPGEAEWNLDVLESLFDFYFVAPARTKARKDALNKKLADAGKPALQ